MTELSQSIREINELIDVVLTLRICQANHPKSNTVLRKCARAMAKRCEEPFVKRVCGKMSHSSDVVRDLLEVQTKLLQG